MDLVTVYWTAPGDDSLTGSAIRYDMRFSFLPITQTNFFQATPIPGLPVPRAPGSQESFELSGLPSIPQCFLAIRTGDDAGNWSKISNVVALAGTVTGVDGGPAAPSFSVPWPNPASGSTRCAFQLPRRELFLVEAFDVTGRRVRTIANEWREPGRGELVWDLRNDSGRSVEAGIYLLRARFAAQCWTRRLVVVR